MERMRLLLCIVTLLIGGVAQAEKRVQLAQEAGIVADGVTLCTDAIQRVVDQMSLEGGGVLRFTPGVYRTGGIVLRSGVELQLDRGALLSGSTDPEHYKSLIPSEAKDNSTMALIVADGANDIAITGSGMIDGNGRQLALTIDSLLNVGPDQRQRRRAPETMRPKLFFFSNCEDVRVNGLELRNSACWGLSFHACRNLTVENIQFENRAYWNNDGIDVTDCKNVVIRHCDINSADDGICLKSYDTSSCNDGVLIEDCHIRSSASAVKMGTASWGGFRHITVRNIKAEDTFRSAIALECVDGGTLEDVLVENVHATNTGNPIFIRLGHRGGDTTGVARRITIRHFFAEMPFGIPDINYDVRGPGFSVYNPRPSSITGIPGHRVSDVRLEDIEIVYPGRASKGIYYYPLTQIHQVPEKEGDYPEFSMFGELPAWGFYVRHTEDVDFCNVRLSLKDADFRPAFVFDDSWRVGMEGVSLPLMGSGQGVFTLNSSLKQD